MSPASQPVEKHRGPLALVAGKFAVVGVINTLVYFVVTGSLVELALLAPVPASVVGFVFAVLVSFALNTAWTFRQTDQLHLRFARFLIVSVTGMALNTVIMYLVVTQLQLHYLWGMLAVLFVVPPCNFVLNLRWSYKQ
ncbi:MAG: GtrA family protein [Gammaproteobacteria bacterium]|nr:GtrA family protein [Gammaproteobacteria bacterium]